MKRLSGFLTWMWNRVAVKPRATSALSASAIVMAGLFSMPSVAHAACKNAKCAVELQNTPDAVTPVIIQYKSDTTDADAAKITAAKGTFRGHLHGIHAIAAALTSAQMESLAADSKVAHISVDHSLGSRFAPPPGPGANAEGSISTSPNYTAEPINANAVWNLGYNGTGIGVAVIDSGINVTSDLQTNTGASRVVYSQSFVAGELTQTNDPYGHGTHVAGLIAGDGSASTGKKDTHTFYGIAPNVNLINLRVLDENGAGTDSQVIAAIQQAIALKSKYNIRIINLSLGRPIWEGYTQDPLCQAVEQAWQAGILVVVSAGNQGRNLSANTEGYGTIEAPGNDPYVLTIGATNPNNTPANTDDTMASYSSKGPSFVDQIAKPDLVAPGNLVTSVLATTSNLQKGNPTFYTPTAFYLSNGSLTTPSTAYMPLSGTSMAAGVASGAAALLLQAYPALTPDQAKAVLMQTANKSVMPATSSVTDPTSGVVYTAHNDVFTVGAGYLDINAAVTLAGSLTSYPAGPALSPTAVYDTKNGNVILTTSSTALWGASLGKNGTALWGAGSVYGQAAFGGNSTALWGAAATGLNSTALWGASAGRNGTALWGASAGGNGTALWGANDPQAFTALWGAAASGGLNGTALWGAGTPDAATALWGATSLQGETALWGASTSTGSTPVWTKELHALTDK